MCCSGKKHRAVGAQSSPWSAKVFLEEVWPGWNLRKVHEQKQFKQNMKKFGFYPENYQEPGWMISEELHVWVCILDICLLDGLEEGSPESWEMKSEAITAIHGGKYWGDLGIGRRVYIDF